MQRLQRIGAIIAGVFAGGASVGVVEWISSLIHPMPPGLQMEDPEEMRRWISTLPTSAFLMVLVAWAVGCCVGASVARRIAPSRSSIPAWIAFGLLTAATVFNLFAIPHPPWMWPAGIAACMIGGLVGIALMAPESYSVQTSRVIDARIDKVFQTLASVENFSKAVTHITNIEFLTESHYGTGTRFRETRLMNGKEATTELEVTEHVENERVRMVADEGGTIWDTVFEVDQQEANVKISMKMDAKPHNFLAKILTPMILGMVAKAVEKDMDAVKAFCEQE